MQTNESKFSLTASQIKLIACFFMLIDHAGAFIVKPYLDSHMSVLDYHAMRRLDMAYQTCRSVGRITFPIFCFFLIEGFYHTRSRVKYLIRLLIFALISEIPFNLANTGSVFSFDYQNVLFTLAIGLTVLILTDKIRNASLNQYLEALLIMLLTASGAYLAYICNTDYDFKGVLVIVALYFIYPLYKTSRFSFVLSGGLLFSWEWFNNISRIPASLSLIPVYFYNGERGKGFKYFFYLFYPLHLLLIYFIYISLK